MKHLDVTRETEVSWMVSGVLVVEIEPWVFTMASRSEDTLRIVRAHEDEQRIIRTECDGPCGYFGGARRTCWHQRLANAVIAYKTREHHQ